MMTQTLLQKSNVPVRNDSDIVESASVTALVRYLLSNETGLAKNPDYLGNVFVNGKWAKHLSDLEGAKQYFQNNLPGILFYHLIRTKHFDKSMLNWIKKHPNSQVIILGSGYDSRSIRFKTKMKENNIIVYDVDLKALLDYKQSIIHKKLELILDHVRYVSCNFQKDNIIDRLKQHGFDTNKSTFVLWEGVTYFLTEENICYYLKLLRENINNLIQITFDYDFHDFIKGNTNYYGGKELYKLTTDDLGEPHLFGLNYDDVEDYANKNGYKLKSNYTSFMLESLYLCDSFGNSVGKPHGFIGIAEIIKED